MGSKIKQVTHINHASDEPRPSDEVAALPSDLLLKLMTAEDRAKPDGFVANPDIVATEAKALRSNMEHTRIHLGVEGRLAQAEQIKTGANACFSGGKWRSALVGYIAGIWYMRQENAACPTFVLHFFAAAAHKDAELPWKRLAEIPAYLEATPPGSHEVNRLLFISLHLNAAAAALKLSDFLSAKAACTQVLAMDEMNSKAVFRMAQAHEGEGEYSTAASVLMPLLKRDPQNRDARKLIDTLKKRQADEKQKFKGIFEGPAAKDKTSDETPTYTYEYRNAGKTLTSPLDVISKAKSQ